MLQRAKRQESIEEEVDTQVHEDAEREKEMVDLRSGGEGFILWAEEFACVEIIPFGMDQKMWVHIKDLPKDRHPRTGKSYYDLWQEQKKIFRKCLAMEDHRFLYNLLVFCWMRGEGKSLITCLIQLWKFFCWVRQKIMLGANSKDQIKFVHFDIIKDIILNSPELYKAVGVRNIQEKEIRLTNRYGEITSLIRPISSFTGILSNITGFTFSEMFEMKNPKFFSQLYGSIRNMPNALGVIDSTVSEKDHILYKIYNQAKEKVTKLTYFSHRQSPLAVPEDYWNPNMDDLQLNDYKANLLEADFDRYFKNTWEAGRIQLFSDVVREATKYVGIDSGILNNTAVFKALEEKYKVKDEMDDLIRKDLKKETERHAIKIAEINGRFRHMEEFYQIKYEGSNVVGASIYDLQVLSDLFDTDWAILAGLDYADPMAIRKRARTIYSLIAKGLPGSRTNPYQFEANNAALAYIYLLIRLVNASDHTINYLKEEIEKDHENLDGIDTICSERFGSWDMIQWSEDRDIKFIPTFPNYGRQREAFKEYYTLAIQGRYKRVPVPIEGMRSPDIIDEEMEYFDHDPDKKWFGSREKEEKYGVQDDTQFSIAWGIYGGMELTVADLRPRTFKRDFGIFIPNTALMGNS